MDFVKNNTYSLRKDRLSRIKWNNKLIKINKFNINSNNYKTIMTIYCLLRNRSKTCKIIYFKHNTLDIYKCQN